MQVPLTDGMESVAEGGVIQLRRDVRSVVYIPAAHAAELLHLPPHIFALLQAWIRLRVSVLPGQG